MAENDPSFGVASATLIDSKRSEGLTICPVTYVELAPVFDGNARALDEFLLKLGAIWPETWTLTDTIAAHDRRGRSAIAPRPKRAAGRQAASQTLWTADLPPHKVSGNRPSQQVASRDQSSNSRALNPVPFRSDPF